jgi:Zn-dependent protease
MSWNTEEFSEYAEASIEHDYANPSYYQQSAPQSPRSAQPVQELPSLESYADYEDSPTAVNEQYDSPEMSVYRGPSSLDGYTTDVGTEQREAAKNGSAPSSKKRKGLAGLGGIGAAIAGLLVKFKTLLLLLLNFKWFAFVAKFGVLGLSAIASIFVYSLIFGWQFAVGLVVLLFIHEMGHAVVMKLKGIPIGGMIFIPLLGAAVVMRHRPRNAKDEAEVGIAGPIAGAIASSACLALAGLSPNTPTIWVPLAYFGFFINLFNLIPIVPFDGGRVLAAIDRRIWILGFIGLLAFQIWTWINGEFSPWLLLFVVMAATQLWSRRAAPNTPETQAYYAVPIGERVILGLLYFGLAAVLVLGMTISHNMLLAGLAR